MGRVVQMSRLPRLHPRQETPFPAQLSFALEVQQGAGSHITAAQAAGAVLSAFGVPDAVASRITETARLAGHYLLGHSAALQYWVLVTTDADGITVMVTDYNEEPLAGQPAWSPTRHLHRLPAPSPAQNPFPAGVLQVHHTRDGYVRVGSHTPWPTPPPP